MLTVSGSRFALIYIAATCILLLTLLASCNPQPPSTATPATTPLPAIALRPVGGTVKAAGKVAPLKVANLSLSSAGTIVSLTVQMGDWVEAGEQLLTLDNRIADANLIQAEAALQQAEANLALLQAAPRSAEITAAQANLEAAKARLAQLQEQVLPATIDAANADLAAAQAARQQLEAGTTEQAIINARLTLSNSEVALLQAQTAFDQVGWRQDAATLPEGIQLQLAKNNHEAAQALYATLSTPPTADQIASADARIAQVQAVLATLQMPASASQLAEAEAMVKSAQAALDLLTAAPHLESVAAATAAISQSQAALLLAQIQLADRQLLAPFAGTVTAINGNLGENLLPGQTIITIADLSVLQIETTDLSERDVARLAIGQPVAIFVEASGKEITGKVLRIAPQATTIGGDVVFPVTIALDEQSPELRWGMSVQVEIETE